MKKNKKTVVYLTGMSVDKIEWDRIYAEAFNDRDFERGRLSAIEQTKKIAGSPLAEFIKDAGPDEALGIGLEFLADFGIPGMAAWRRYQDGQDLRKDMATKSELSARTSWLNHLFHEPDILHRLHEEIASMDVTISDSTVVTDSVFSMYLCNQGDIRALSALSKFGEKYRKYRVQWGYGDMPYCDNVYIDSLGIFFSQNFIGRIRDSDDLIDRVCSCFREHYLDVFLSRAIERIFSRDSVVASQSKQRSLRGF